MNLFLCVGVLDNFVQLGLVESRITMRMIGIVDCDNELDNGYAECSIAFCHRVCLMAHLVSCVGNMLQGMLESNFSQTLSPLSLMYHDVCRALSPVWMILMAHEVIRNSFSNELNLFLHLVSQNIFGARQFRLLLLR